MTALRKLVRCRRLLLELHALPPGTLPEEIDDEIEDLLMPGYRERLMVAYLASLSNPSKNATRSGPPDTLAPQSVLPGKPSCQDSWGDFHGECRRKEDARTNDRRARVPAGLTVGL
jgi:hypothetical protein